MNRIRPGVRLVLSTLALALFAAPISAQMSVFVAAGPTMASISGEDVNSDNIDSVSGFFATIGGSLAIHRNVLFRPGVGFAQKGFANAQSDDEVSYSFITFPVLASATVAVSGSTAIYATVGPVLGLRMGCERTNSAGSSDCPEADDPACTDTNSQTICFRTTDAGAFGGLSIGFPVTNSLGLELGAGYELGLRSIVEELDFKNRTIYIFGRLATRAGG